MTGFRTTDSLTPSQGKPGTRTDHTGAINPKVAESFRQSGWQMVAEEFDHPVRKVPVQPEILKLDELNPRFQSFIRKQRIEHVFHSFERTLFRSGEELCRIGDSAQHVFVVADGTLRVTNKAGRELAMLTVGEVVGESALLMDQNRTANVAAVTDIWVMMLSREVFRQQLEESLGLPARSSSSWLSACFNDEGNGFLHETS